MDLDALILQAPQGGHGARIEANNQTLYWDDFNWDEENYDPPSWRIAVEIAVPKGQANVVWGQAVWGQSVWSEVDWTDLTPHVAGTQIERGSGPDAERPDPGILTVTLVNLDPYPFSPWSDEPFVASSYMGAGTLIRVVMHDPVLGIWSPLYGGIVEDWQEGYESDDSGLGFITITAVETVTLLARINDVALGSVVGLDDTPPARIERLLAAAEWRYGFLSGTASTEPLQSTDMALTRLTECYLVADSIDAVFRSGRDGRAMLLDKDTTNIEYEGSAYPRFVIAHEGGGIEPADLTGLPTFAPGIETRPVRDNAVNLLSESSFEDGTPVLWAAVSDFDVAPDTAHAYTGTDALRLTIDSTNSGAHAALAFVVDVTPEMTAQGAYVSYRLYVPTGSPYIGKRVLTSLTKPDTTDSLNIASSVLVQGWNLVSPGANFSAANIAARTVSGQVRIVLAFIFDTSVSDYMYVSGNDGAQVWLDDVMLKAGTTSASWEPGAGEPFFRGGDSWAVTIDGTYAGLDLFDGDVITVANDPADGWVAEADVVWSVVQDLSGYRIPYDDTSLLMANNDDAIVNAVVLSCEGGTEQKYTDAPSIARYDARFFERANLQYKTTNQAAASEYVADRVLARSHTYRPYACTVTYGHDRSVLDFFAALDLGLLTDVITRHAVFRNVSVASYVHRIVPLQESVEWSCEITFSPSMSYAWTKL